MSLEYIKSRLWKYLTRNAYLDYGEEIIERWIIKSFQNKKGISVLDVGSSSGRDLLLVKNTLKGAEVKLYGIDCNGDYVLELEKKGIKAKVLDIERERLPFDNNTFDLIICNQVIEHTKEIFWIFSEFCRVLKIGGYLIVGVPNLSAFHNCFLLFLGRQPMCLRVLGPHVRGYTYYGFKDFVEASGELQVEKVAGSNFYPMSSFYQRFYVSFFLFGHHHYFSYCIER